MLVPVNLAGTWDFSSYFANGTGSVVSGKFIFKPGTHEFPIPNANFTMIPFYQKFDTILCFYSR